MLSSFFWLPLKTIMYTSQLLCTKGKNLFVLPLTSKPDPEVVKIIFFDGVSNSLEKCKIMVRVVSAGNRIQVKNNKSLHRHCGQVMQSHYHINFHILQTWNSFSGMQGGWTYHQNYSARIKWRLTCFSLVYKPTKETLTCPKGFVPTFRGCWANGWCKLLYASGKCSTGNLSLMAYYLTCCRFHHKYPRWVDHYVLVVNNCRVSMLQIWMCDAIGTRQVFALVWNSTKIYLCWICASFGLLLHVRLSMWQAFWGCLHAKRESHGIASHG